MKIARGTKLTRLCHEETLKIEKEVNNPQRYFDATY